MKKLVRMAAVLFIVTPMFFACESLNGELEEISGPQTEFTTLNGGEDGGDDIPDEPGGGK